MKNNYLKILFITIFSLGLNSLSAQVVNYDCENALPISEGIYFVEDLSQGNGAYDGCFASGTPINAVWYEYTPSATGTVMISSEIDPETTDTRLSVYSGSCDDLTCLAFDDDSGQGFTSLLYVDVVEGESVYIEWDDRWSSNPFQFVVTPEGVSVEGCTDPNAENYDPQATIDDGSCYYDIDCSENEVILNFVGGSFLSEISWSVTDDSGEIYASGYYYTAQGTPLHQLCLPDGCYSFNMYDGFGDGWEGASASLSVGNNTIGQGTLAEGTVGNFTFGVNVSPCEDIVLDILGCTDPDALNYNVNATVDDGSCVFPFSCDEGIAAQLYVCVFGSGEQVGFELSGSDGTIVYEQNGFNDMAVLTMDICLQEEVCYTALMYNNEGPFGWYGGYYWINVDGFTISTGALEEGEAEADLIFSVDGTCGEILGCTDPEAENYNPDATLDNGSCTYFIANDECENAQPLSEGTISINNQGASSSGLYGDCWGFGQGEPEQNGIWYSFTTPADPALIIIEALDDGSYTLTDTQFGLYDECGGEMIACDGNSGEGLLSKFEFPCGSLEANTTYYLLIDGWAGDQGTCLLDYQVVEECESIEGCTDPVAINYNPVATVDDGSCQYVFDCTENEVLVEFETGSFPGEVFWYIMGENGGDIFAEGGVETVSLCLPDGCYQLVMTDSWGDGWNNNILHLYTADGLILTATIDDGEYGIANFSINSECDETYGCTDPTALNYDPTATVDDGNCVYDSECEFNEAQVFIFNNEGSFVFWELTNTAGTFSYGSFIENVGQNLSELCIPDGCYNLCFYGEFGNIGGFVDITVGGVSYAYDYQDLDCFSFSVNSSCDGEDVYGCTDPEALNYNPVATIDDGSCITIGNGECEASFEILSIDQDEDVMYILNTSSFGWGYEYMWDFGDGNTSTAPLPVHTYEEDGAYTICLTVNGPENCEDTFCMDIFYESPGFAGSNGSTGGFTINVVDDNVTGISENLNEISLLQLYPNPTTDVINMDYVLKTGSKMVLSIYDVAGTQISSQSFDQSAGFKHQIIDVENLATGMYLLEIQVNDERDFKRFSILK